MRPRRGARSFVRMMKACLTSLIVALALVLGSAGAGQAQTCRQALVLGLDVSLSVDPGEFELQREGLAQALEDPSVLNAMMRGGAGYVTLAVFEWSGQYDQSLLSDWQIIRSAEDLARVAAALRQSPQRAASGRTGIGAAMLFAQRLMAEQRHCAVLTLDLSGDGVSNNGVAPEDVRGRLAGDGIIVNALVIGQTSDQLFFGEIDALGLTRYYLENVIIGPGSFVETVIGFENYAEAIRRKMLREISPVTADVPAHNLPRLARGVGP
ncbi:MAG: DUF1194 domain-containing protein [Arenibacterium sp.]